MIRMGLGILLAVFVSAGGYTAPVVLPEAAEQRLEAGERVRVIVEFSAPALAYARENGASDAEISRIVSQAREATFQRVFDRPGALMARLDDGAPGPVLARAMRYSPHASMVLNQDDIARLANDPGVAVIRYEAPDAPHLYFVNQIVGTAALHDAGYRGDGVSIAILDSGVDLQHPAFAGRIVDSACFSSTVPGQSESLCIGGAPSDTINDQAGDNCELPSADPDNGLNGCDHGTHVAGIALGSQLEPFGPSQPVVGIAPQAGLVAVQVFSRFFGEENCGSQSTCLLGYPSDQMAALEWVYDNRAAFNLAAVNMSLGGGRYRTACDADERRPIVQMLREAGVATVISSGNNGFSDSVSAPACIREAITVSVTDSFGNRGPEADISAIGFVLSAVPGPNDSGEANVGQKAGTSMAAPIVAGAVALLAAETASPSVDQIESVLKGLAYMHGYEASLEQPVTHIPLMRAHEAMNYFLPLQDGRIGNLSLSSFGGFHASSQYFSADGELFRDYTLINQTGSATDWIVSSAQSWIRFQVVPDGGGDPDEPVTGERGGQLPAGGRVTVRVSVDTAVPNAGSYRGVAWFGSSSAPLRAPIPVDFDRRQPPPLNDNFANAAPITGSANQQFRWIYFNNAFSTLESGEPMHFGSETSHTLWWRITPPFDGQMTLRASTQGVSSAMALYTGTALDNLVAVNSAGGPGLARAELTHPVIAGQTYYLVTGNPSTGSAALGYIESDFIPSTVNDDPETATVISGESGLIRGTAVGATLSDAEALRYSSFERPVWYRWTAPTTGTYHVYPSFDVEVFTDTSLTQQALVSRFNRDIADRPNTFDAVAGQTYHFVVAGSRAFLMEWMRADRPRYPLRASILPSARAVRPGETATAYATIVNPASSGQLGRNCRIEPDTDFTGEFHFQTTDPDTNALTGTRDTPVDIPAGQSRTFVVAVTPNTDSRDAAPGFDSPESNQVVNIRTVDFYYACDFGRAELNAASRFSLYARQAPPPDIIAIAATPTGNGVIEGSPSSRAAFALSAINIGYSGRVWVRPLGSDIDGVSLSICETDPVSGVCVSERLPHLETNFANGAVKTFAVFVDFPEGEIAFAPANRRITVDFQPLDPWVTVGRTSVAVRTR